MEFAILGPLRVGGPDGAIEISAPKQRSLLAMLLLAHREDVVSAEPPDRRAVGRAPPRHRDQGAAGARLAAAARARRGHDRDPRERVRDRARAGAAGPRALRGAGRARRATHRPRRPRALLREALALFRGPPLADAPLYGPAATEADRLAEQRLAALEQRIELDLQLGRHRGARRRARGLTTEHPYRERLHAQLMLALYRSGRQADALEAYRRARHALVEDLGLDPSPELQRLEAAILAQDPALEADAPPPPPRPAPARRRSPRRPTPLLGRDEDLDTAIALLAEPTSAAHAHRAGRDRQDALRARARAPARTATSPTARASSSLARPRRAGARRPGARAGCCGLQRARS